MKTLPPNLQQEISKKGFVVYHYISFFELMQTVKRDYLEIVSIINIPMIIFSGIIGIISPFMIVYILPVIYFCIFLFLLWKMFWRTQKYIYISRVIFTEKKILIGEDVLDYIEGWKDGSILSQYEDEFDEYLTRDSQISSVIRKQEKIFKKQLQKIFSSIKYLDRDTRDSKVGLAIIFAVYIYGISLFLFYYLGIFLGYIFFGIFAGILQVFLFFSQKIEIKIKSSVEDLERNIQALRRTESMLARKLENFSEGEISDISEFVGEKFSYFYSLIYEILQKQKKLEKIIQNSDYQKFINFQKFSQYIKTEYNKPVSQMIKMLEKFSQKISQQKVLIETEISELSLETKAQNPENSAHLTKKLLRFEQMEKDAQHNLEKLKMMKV